MCSDQTTHEAVSFFQERFGVDEGVLNSFRFQTRGDDIWATTAPATLGIPSPRMAGLRALRRTPHGLKPTSAFLSCLAPHLQSSIVRFDLEAARQLLLGRQLDTDVSDGFVAIFLNGDLLGCGRASGGRVTALIPTGRRRELLEALDWSP